MLIRVHRILHVVRILTKIILNTSRPDTVGLRNDQRFIRPNGSLISVRSRRSLFQKQRAEMITATPLTCHRHGWPCYWAVAKGGTSFWGASKIQDHKVRKFRANQLNDPLWLPIKRNKPASFKKDRPKCHNSIMSHCRESDRLPQILPKENVAGQGFLHFGDEERRWNDGVTGSDHGNAWPQGYVNHFHACSMLVPHPNVRQTWCGRNVGWDIWPAAPNDLLYQHQKYRSDRIAWARRMGYTKALCTWESRHGERRNRGNVHEWDGGL